MTTNGDARAPSAFFRRCRFTLRADLDALSWGLSVGKRNIRRWEDGSRPIPGGVWQRMSSLLHDSGHIGMARVIELRRLTAAEE